MSKRLRFKCFRCGAPSNGRRQHYVSATVLEIQYLCSNPHCGHQFVCLLEAVRTVNPGAFPCMPGVSVPLSSHLNRRRLIEELQMLPSADAGTEVPLPAHVAQAAFDFEAAGPPPGR